MTVDANRNLLKSDSFLAKMQDLPDEGNDTVIEINPDGTFFLDVKLPEHFLVAAVIEVGIRDYVELRCNEPKRIKNTTRWIEVRKWFHSNDDEPFTFVWCLSHLFPEPESMCKAIRKKIQTLTETEEFFFREVLKGNYKTYESFRKNEVLNKKLKFANMRVAA